MYSAPNSRRPWQRLNVRLALWHSALMIATVMGILVAAYFALGNRVEAQDRDVVVFRLNQFSAEYAQRGLNGVISLAAWRKGRAQRAFFVRVATLENRTLFIRDEEDWVDFSPQQLENLPGPAANEVSWLTLRAAGNYELLLAENRLPDGTIVQVGKSTEESVDLMREFRFVSLVVVGLALPISLVGGALVASRALRPLRSLTTTVREIHQTGLFSARTAVGGSGDELDELSKVFNATMGRIETLLRTMRESLDNVAHDLRTPMTRLRHRAQSSLEGESSEEDIRLALAECVEESDRVLQTLDTLMDIAEAEAGLIRVSPTPVEAHDLIQTTLDLYLEVADDKNITVRNDVPRGVLLDGDPVLLRRVFANLLDNAIKYTPSGGEAVFSVERANGTATVALRDSGQGVAAEDLPKVWERLFRGDRSRAKRGLGLGLSFVKAIVEAHGGQVHATSTAGKGSTFWVTLPMAQAPVSTS